MALWLWKRRGGRPAPCQGEPLARGRHSLALSSPPSCRSAGRPSLGLDLPAVFLDPVARAFCWICGRGRAPLMRAAPTLALPPSFDKNARRHSKADRSPPFVDGGKIGEWPHQAHICASKILRGNATQDGSLVPNIQPPPLFPVCAGPADGTWRRSARYTSLGSTSGGIFRGSGSSGDGGLPGIGGVTGTWSGGGGNGVGAGMGVSVGEGGPRRGRFWIRHFDFLHCMKYILASPQPWMNALRARSAKIAPPRVSIQTSPARRCVSPLSTGQWFSSTAPGFHVHGTTPPT